MIYIVRYSRGNYDEYIVYNQFVTNNFKLAEEYVHKFNNVIRAFKRHRENYPSDQNYDDHYGILCIRNAFLEQIKVR